MSVVENDHGGFDLQFCLFNDVEFLNGLMTSNLVAEKCKKKHTKLIGPSLFLQVLSVALVK